MCEEDRNYTNVHFLIYTVPYTVNCNPTFFSGYYIFQFSLHVFVVGNSFSQNEEQYTCNMQ